MHKGVQYVNATPEKKQDNMIGSQTNYRMFLQQDLNMYEQVQNSSVQDVRNRSPKEQ